MTAPDPNIAAAIAAATAFGEKGRQVSPSDVTAFGFSLRSRYGKSVELAELLRLAEGVAALGAAHFVRSAFYDSKTGLCSFELSDGAISNGLMAESLATSIRMPRLTRAPTDGSSAMHGRKQGHITAG